jgi:four helix bundle protein
MYGLTNQIRRSVVSIPSNIAEGFGRKTDKSFSYFIDIARGSLYELETQLIIARELNLSTEIHTFDSTLALLAEEAKMLNSFSKTLKNNT